MRLIILLLTILCATFVYDLTTHPIIFGHIGGEESPRGAKSADVYNMPPLQTSTGNLAFQKPPDSGDQTTVSPIQDLSHAEKIALMRERGARIAAKLQSKNETVATSSKFQHSEPSTWVGLRMKVVRVVSEQSLLCQLQDFGQEAPVVRFYGENWRDLVPNEDQLFLLTGHPNTKNFAENDRFICAVVPDENKTLGDRSFRAFLFLKDLGLRANLPVSMQ